MLRLPLSASFLANQLGKQFQTKFSPVLYVSPLCIEDRRFTHPSSESQLLQPKTLPKSNLCVFHTSPKICDSQKQPPSPKAVFADIWKEVMNLMSTVNIKDVKNAPTPVQVLGFSGLIPFVLPPIAVLLNGAFLPNMAFAQLAYGCSILAFLGGVKWGFNIPESSVSKPTWENLRVSVTWPLVAWGSLLLPQILGTLTLMGGIAAAAYLDLLKSGYPSWFKALRVCLSAVAFGSLLLMLLLRILS